jgi:hypothetical protein
MSDKTQALNQPPIKIGHYVLAETLGIGSFGKVKSISHLIRVIII